jgi:predicted nuclease with TOPRIM domain
MLNEKDRLVKTLENKLNQVTVENKTLSRKITIRDNTVSELKNKIEELSKKKDRERKRDNDKFTQLFHAPPKSTSAVDAKALTAINL